MARIGFMASEEMSFENDDDDRRLMPGYAISSGELKIKMVVSKKHHKSELH